MIHLGEPDPLESAVPTASEPAESELMTSDEENETCSESESESEFHSDRDTSLPELFTGMEDPLSKEDGKVISNKV